MIRSEFSMILAMLRRNRGAMMGFGVIVAFVLTAIFAPLIAPHDPTKQDLAKRLSPPSAEYPLGQDEFGRCILSRIIFGARISLQVGIVVAVISIMLGTITGALSGYFGGRIDKVIMVFGDIFLAFPGLVLAIAMVAALGRSIFNVMAALAIVSWPTYSRVVRSQALYLKKMVFVDAAKTMGSSNFRIIIDHILPNSIAPVIVLATLGMGWAILAEAGLSFIGLGPNPPTASWGGMIASGRNFMLIAPHVSIFPGIAIAMTVLAFNLFGDGLRDALDPNLRI